MDPVGTELQVILFTGLPGTGKSTLAERVARIVRAPAFAGDWLMGGLKPARAALGKLDRAQYLAAWFGLLRTLVTRQLMLDQSAIVDDLVSAEQFVLWQEVAEHFAARLYLIECVCSDEAVHRARIDGRIRDIPGWHEVGWNHVQRMRAESVRHLDQRRTAVVKNANVQSVTRRSIAGQALNYRHHGLLRLEVEPNLPSSA